MCSKLCPHLIYIIGSCERGKGCDPGCASSVPDQVIMFVRVETGDCGGGLQQQVSGLTMSPSYSMSAHSRYSQVKEGKYSHAEELVRMLPPTVSLVKAFNTLEVSDLVGERCLVKDVGIVSDNPSAR